MSTPLFFDDFNRANSSMVGNGWSQVSGSGVSRGISSNELFNTSGATGSSIVISRAVVGLGDNAVAARFVAGASNYSVNDHVAVALSLHAGPQSANDGYMLYAYQPGRFRLFRYDNGSSTALANLGNLGDLSGKMFALRRVGSTLQIMLDQQVVGTVSDGTHTNFGWVWVRCNSTANNTTRADDFYLYSAADYQPIVPEPTLNAFVNVDGVWKSTTDLYVNVGGVWKTATELQVNDGGWKS